MSLRRLTLKGSGVQRAARMCSTEPVSSNRDQPWMAAHSADSTVADLAAGSSHPRVGARARYMPDGRVTKGASRVLADKPTACLPAAVLVSRLSALIPKLIVQACRPY